MTKKVLYIDLDNTLVDFASGIARLSAEDTETYRGNYDDAPGIFALMDPMPGAIEAHAELATLFDTYLLSTAPWKNPTAWSDKLLWVQRHIGLEEGTPAHKRLILSHHKHLNRGDSLADSRDARGAREFAGEWLQFGAGDFGDWAATVAYWRGRA